MAITYTVVLLFGGFFLIQVTYAAFKNNWPEVYLALSETFALGIVSRWWRILAFRGVRGILQ